MIENGSENLKIPSIPTNYSRLAARTLGLNEKNLDRLLVGTDISAKEFLRDDTLLSGYQQIRILSNAQDMAGDDAFGLRFGQRVTPSTHGPLGFLVNSSPTLVSAMEAFREFLPLRMNLTSITVVRGEHWLECGLYASPGVPDRLFCLFMEVLGLATYAIAESTLGRQLEEAELCLRYPEPAYSARYRDIFPCQIRFAAEVNCLRIPAALANTANISADHNIYETAQLQCRELLQRFNKDLHTSKSQVRRLLLSNPNHQMPEQDVAAAMFVSKRTLARRLAEEGTSFRLVRDEVLATLADGYLKNSRLSVDAIASLLNYHDSSNFRRAFKRWRKMTPEQFRKCDQ